MPRAHTHFGICVALRSVSTPTHTVAAALGDLPGSTLKLRLPRGGTVAADLTPDHLAQVVSHTLRGEDILLAVLLDRPATQLPLRAEFALRRAAEASSRIYVDALPGDPRRHPLLIALQLAAAIMRRRTPAMWAALDVLDACDGNAERAASRLGCSGQAVRERRARANAAATAELPVLFAAILTP